MKIKNFCLIIFDICSLLYFGFGFLFMMSELWRDFIVNICLALISLLFSVVAINIIIGFCNILKESIERYGE